jgi:predicted transcriptional regulator
MCRENDVFCAARVETTHSAQFCQQQNTHMAYRDDMVGLTARDTTLLAYTLPVLFSQELRAWINSQLAERRIRPATVARRMRVSQSTISGYLSGRRDSIGMDVLDRLFTAVREIAAEGAIAEVGGQALRTDNARTVDLASRVTELERLVAFYHRADPAHPPAAQERRPQKGGRRVAQKHTRAS